MYEIKTENSIKLFAKCNKKKTFLLSELANVTCLIYYTFTLLRF